MEKSLHSLIRRKKYFDRLFLIVGLALLLGSLFVLLGLLIQLGIRGSERLSFSFLSSFTSYDPQKAGILPGLVGSLWIMAITALVSVPLGVASGVYLEEYARKNRLTSFIEISIANLAAVPSIIYGLMGLAFFVYLLSFGHTMIAAGLTLALLILPIVILTTRESIRSIPGHIREASYALGATQWQTVRYHVLPYSLGGILTGIIIGLSRAIGETAPLIMIGAVVSIRFVPSILFQTDFPFIVFDRFNERFTVLPVQMFRWVSESEEAFQVNAAAAGLVLIVLTLALNGIAIYIRYRYRKKVKWMA